jgi:hypothetical protein
MNDSISRRRFSLAAAAAAAPLLLPGVANGATLSDADARALGTEAYVYGFPLIDLYRILWGYFADKGGAAYKAPVNTLYNTARVYTPADTTVQTPNSDTPYSFAFLDLRAEPWVVTLPPIDAKRYYSVQIVDQYTYNTDYLGTRATGNGGGDFLIAGPRWNGKPPSGIKKVVRLDTELTLLLYRTQLFGPSDLDAVKAIQAKYAITPLSKYAGSAPPAAPAAIAWIDPLSPAQERTSLRFFDILAWVLQYCPPYPDEVAFRARLAKIGVTSGKRFNPASLPLSTQQALVAGMKDGQAEIDAARTTLKTSANLFGSRAQLGSKYLDRVLGAQFGILGNTAAEAVYLGYQVDSTKAPLSGAKAYTLRFPPGQSPPVNAFWSLTMYELPQQLLVANALNRYLINSPMIPQLKPDVDGGYTLVISHASPGADKESNWLPAPAGAFLMVLRCYYPKQPVIDGSWTQPPLRPVT